MQEPFDFEPELEEKYLQEAEVHLAFETVINNMDHLCKHRLELIAKLAQDRVDAMNNIVRQYEELPW